MTRHRETVDRAQPPNPPATSTGLRSWWRDVVILMAVALLAERLLHEAVNSVALPASTRGWIDAIGLVVVLGPLLSWTLYRRSLESRLSGRRTSPNRLPRSPHKAVRIAMLSSLGVLTAAALLAQGFEREVLNEAGAASLLVDHAGRQRYLSQVIARHASESVTSPKAWSSLRTASERLGQEGVTMDSLERRWFDVAGISDEAAEAGAARTALLAATARAPRSASEAAALIATADRFLVAQDRYVQRVGIISSEELSKLAETQLRFGIGLLVLFAGIALLVVEPTVRLLRRQHSANGALGREFERLALVAERTSTAVVITDAEQRIEWVNDAFVTRTGYSSEEAIGLRQGSLLHGPDTDAATVAELRARLQAQESVRAVLLNYSKSGVPYWVDLSIEPLRDATGVITGFISVESDVTGLIEARHALERERAELQRVAAQSEAAQRVARYGHWEYDLATGHIDWSPGTYLLFGRDPASGPPGLDEAVSGYAPQDAVRLEDAIARTTISGEPYSLELKTAGHNPDVRYVHAIGSVRHDADGRPVALYGTAADITASVEMQAQLEAARIKAEDASRSKSEFLANMSHEIRSPLNVILGFADVLRDRAQRRSDGAQQIDAIATIRRAGHHLAQVINDILDISKIEAGRMEVEWVATGMSALFRDIESLLRPHAAGKGIDLRFSLRSAVPERILTDPTRLRQILMNLVGNAIKFTEIGEVRVDVSVDRKGVEPILVVVVEDTGIGMSPEQASVLFQPFTQADTSVTRRFGGTGLGLTISRRLSLLLGGDVTLLHSVQGQGSGFEVRVPLRAIDDGAEIVEFSSAISSARAESVAVDSLAGCRILLAEDGPDNQVLIQLLLEEAGATVALAANGRIALELATTTEPPASAFDLVLTDMQMPEMDGYTLARQLRAHGSDVPIVALTANAMSEDRLRCLDAGCSDYATKPVERAHLIETCAKWATPRAARRSTPAATASPASPASPASASRPRSILALNPILAQLARKFSACLPERAEAIVRLVDSEDLGGARALAHQLRGSAGSYGFPRITEIAGQIEDALEASDRAAVSPLLELLLQETDAARALSATP